MIKTNGEAGCAQLCMANHYQSPKIEEVTMQTLKHIEVEVGLKWSKPHFQWVLRVDAHHCQGTDHVTKSTTCIRWDISKVRILMIRLEQIPWLILVLIAIAYTWQIQFLAGIVSIIGLLLVMNLQFTPRSPKFSVHKLLLIKNIDKRIDENVNC